ncbi:M16 family metallopeptidase [Lutispora thermophila]|uniref:Predicted Zn-dependent peptidase n=1 Tax=Lutispora thermophila DSM 19022 TaxID=1122184 RepID=A0A1M6I5G8_9FIRM|nr:pitrilysin family protein [Lutispora thermophila]SHJ29668.1 Predicted Zn-dependent peptidase [Lutispora thermophila DSM 19022]
MYIRHKLENGVRIVAEEIKYVNSVSIGIWVKVGSRNENNHNNGMSHFIEHMLFKGTKNRTAKEIAGSIDKIGGQLNAFTAKECTCFYAKVLDSHFDIALDILTDMFFNSSFSESEMEKEKGVVLEEIGMYEDSPEDLVHDIFTQSVWKGNSLGMPILGTEKTLKAIRRQDIIDYMGANYTPENIVVSVVGNFNKEHVLKEIEKAFSNYKTSKKNEVVTAKPTFTPSYNHKEKNTEQAHLCIGFNGLELGNEYTYSLLVLNNIFGGAMSSRLFQKIREDKGLAYSVFSYPSSYTDCGILSIYAGMKPNQLDYVIELIIEEIKDIKENGISENELYDSKEQIKGSYILGLESTSGRMNSIGKSELLLNKIYSPKEIIELIDKVTMDDINNVIDLVFNTDEMSAAVIGPKRSTILG